MITRKVGLVAALLALLTATGAAATQVGGDARGPRPCRRRWQGWSKPAARDADDGQ